MTPADRYALLVAQLGKELEFARGWQSRAADQLGVHRSYVSRIHSGDRAGIGATVISRAMSRLGVAPSFFYGDDASGEPHFRDHVGTATPSDPESGVMASLAALDDQARERVLDWAAKRWGSR